MPFRLKAGESVHEGLGRIVAEEAQSAAEGLTRSPGGGERDEAIHEARKSIKKIRSVLRLVRGELGNTYQAENKRLQALGQKLSVFRDSAALLEVLDVLKEKYKDQLGTHDVDAVRRALVTRKEQTDQQPELAPLVQETVDALRNAGRRLKTWPLETGGFGAIAPGFEKTFRRGRKAMDRARTDPRPENFHEWRKRAKDHWYHVRLLEDLWTTVFQGYERSLKELENWLGDDHNLVLLREKISADRTFYGNPADVEFVLELIGRYQKELRDNSLSVGERIYEEKPARLTKRIKHLWQAWQSEPKTLALIEKQERQQAKSAKTGAGIGKAEGGNPKASSASRKRQTANGKRPRRAASPPSSL